MSTAENDIISNKNSINSLFSGKADKSTVIALGTRVSTAESQIVSINQSLSPINTFMATDPEQRITTLEGKVAANENDIQGNTNAISSLDGRLGTVETSLTNAKGDIAQNSLRILQNENSITNLQTRMATSESNDLTQATNISTNSQRITANTVKTGENAGAISGLDTRLGIAETSITSLNNRLYTTENKIVDIEGELDKKHTVVKDYFYIND